MELAILARLVSQWVLGIFLFVFSQCCGYRHMFHSQLLSWYWDLNSGLFVV